MAKECVRIDVNMQVECTLLVCPQDGDDNDTKTALAMYAKDGEYVEFPGPCDCNGQVGIPRIPGRSGP